MTIGEAGNDGYQWHDNLIYAIQIEAADPDRGVWRSNLVLDIDHIVEWVCGVDGGAKFRVAPATLVFHDVTDLRIRIDFGNSDHRQTALNELSIAAIFKEPIRLESAVGPYAYFGWRIELNLPQGGEIAFGASGFTQTLRAEPHILDQPRLPASDRPYLPR